eukprot:11228309-Lingulodinium_polyedra.AAC.2
MNSGCLTTSTAPLRHLGSSFSQKGTPYRLVSKGRCQAGPSPACTRLRPLDNPRSQAEHREQWGMVRLTTKLPLELPIPSHL